jgi:hypothetical protein
VTLFGRIPTIPGLVSSPRRVNEPSIVLPSIVLTATPTGTLGRCATLPLMPSLDYNRLVAITQITRERKIYRKSTIFFKKFQGSCAALSPPQYIVCHVDSWHTSLPTRRHSCKGEQQLPEIATPPSRALGIHYPLGKCRHYQETRGRDQADQCEPIAQLTLQIPQLRPPLRHDRPRQKLHGNASPARQSGASLIQSDPASRLETTIRRAESRRKSVRALPCGHERGISEGSRCLARDCTPAVGGVQVDCVCTEGRCACQRTLDSGAAACTASFQEHGESNSQSYGDEVVGMAWV